MCSAYLVFETEGRQTEKQMQTSGVYLHHFYVFRLPLPPYDRVSQGFGYIYMINRGFKLGIHNGIFETELWVNGIFCGFWQSTRQIYQLRVANWFHLFLIYSICSPLRPPLSLTDEVDNKQVSYRVSFLVASWCENFF